MRRRGVLRAGICASLVIIVGFLTGEVRAAEVWVTNMKAANVQVFDPATLTLVATIPADKGAHNVTFSPDETLAFIDTRPRRCRRPLA